MWGLLALVVAVSAPLPARAALGEDEAATIRRYGPDPERGTVNRKADFTLHWERKDRIITAAFVDGTCGMVTYAMKEGAGEIPVADVAAALAENVGPDSATWSEPIVGAASTTWRRSDGKATAIRIGDILMISTKEFAARKPKQ
ncbi:hypothetical protein DB346_04210 [Verrucomicrobia bacterium LW23]|nr:hypothetical protein DB346_04210 [Verrucomicrobia bacterium LW23]